MAIKSKIYFSIFLIIAIFNYANSQNIITSWHYDKVQMYDLETIGDIFVDDTFTDIIFDDFSEYSIDIKNLKITSVHQSLYDSYLNFKSGLFLFMPDKVSFSFEFEYTYEGSSAKATFDFKMNMIRFRVKNNKEEQTQSANITAGFSENDFSVYDVSDKTLAEKIKLALYAGFKDHDFVNNKILAKIDLVDHYKKRLSKKADFKLTTSIFLNSKEYTIKLNRFIGFCEDVTGERKNSLCYYSGEFENEEDKTDRSKAPINNQDFLNSTDYNTFININLINKIAQKITEEGINEKTFNKNTPKKTLPYSFNLASLKTYFTNLDSYADDIEFSTTIKISEFDSKNAKFNVAFNLGENKNVFSIDVEISMKLALSLKKNVKLNLCVESVSDIKTKISTGDVTIKDEDKLKTAVENSFDFKNYPFCLSDDGISFKDYYSKILKAQTLDEGFYLFGNQLYQ